MKLETLSPHLIFRADQEAPDLPERIQILNRFGDLVACYARYSEITHCSRGEAPFAASFPDVAELPELCATIEVEQGPLPDRLDIEVHGAELCRRHGWDCPQWVREARYVRR